MKRRHLVALIVTIALGGFLWLAGESLVTAWAWLSDRAAVTATAQQLGIWGPAAIFVLLVIQVFLAFIPGQALMIASGFLYGFWTGLAIAWTGLVVGGQAAFFLARKFGRPFAERWVAPATIARWDQVTGQGVGFFALSLVLPVFPNDAMCYVAGLGTISSGRFLVANMLGRGMACLLTSLIGAYGLQIPTSVWIVGIAAFLTASLAMGISRVRAARSSSSSSV